MTAQVDTLPKGRDAELTRCASKGSEVAKRCAQKLRNWLFLRKHMKACRKLARMTEKRRNSFECEQFRRRRAAMLKHTRSIGAT